MKAAVLYRVRDLRLEDVMTSKIKDDEVLIRILTFIQHINCNPLGHFHI